MEPTRSFFHLGPQHYSQAIFSCSSFCDYHDAVNGPSGPFYTVEPYPCAQGCNQCTKDPFDTLTQGLSEEMIELKTDMDPGTVGSLATKKSVTTATQILFAIELRPVNTLTLGMTRARAPAGSDENNLPFCGGFRLLHTLPEVEGRY